MLKNEIFHQYSCDRFEAARLIIASNLRTFDESKELTNLGERIFDYGERVENSSTSESLKGFGEAIKCYSMCLRWKKAVRDAETDSARHLKSAQLKAREYLNEQSGAPEFFREIFEYICQITSLEDIADLREKLLQIRIPFSNKEVSSQGFNKRAFTNPVDHTNIAFVSFTINGNQVQSIETLCPHQMYDLGLEVRISHWPEDAKSMRLEPITVEPKSTFELPIFNFERPDKDAPITVTSNGRMIIRSPQKIGSRPYEFKYTASFWPQSANSNIEIMGHRILRIEGLDSINNPLSGYNEIDKKILEVRSRLRTLPGLSDTEISSALTIIAALGNMSGQALSDAIFPAGMQEKEFQVEAKKYLRRWPEIGEKLEEAPKTGGGITDLSFNRQRIELKAVWNGDLTDDDLSRFADQAAAYATSTGNKIAFLCVLDSRKKSHPPASAASGISIIMKQTGTSYVAVICLVVQGGLARPSNLSKK